MNQTSRPGLRPRRCELSSGLLVISKQSSASPAVSFSLSLRAGSFWDPVKRPGLAHFLSRVIDRGTERHDADQIAELLDTAGVTLSTVVTRHQFTLTCTCLSDDFPSLLSLVSDIVRRPTFPADQIDTRRAEITTGLRHDADNPAMVAVEGLLERLYPGGHPYGRKAKGTPESVGAVTREDLVQFHAARFGPEGTALVVVGDVNEQDAIERASQVFDGWSGAGIAARGTETVPPPAEPDARTLHTVGMPGKSQSDVAYGFVTVPRVDPAYYDLWLMNNVFGQYGLGGRLADNIRERQGMAYYAFSSFDGNLGPGPLVVRAGVDPSNVERTIAAIDHEVAQLAAGGITDKELADSKLYLIGSIPRMLETSAAIAAFLQTAEFFGLGLDYDQRLPGLIAGVTREGAGEAARRFLAPERATIVVAGPPGPGGT